MMGEFIQTPGVAFSAAFAIFDECRGWGVVDDMYRNFDTCEFLPEIILLCSPGVILEQSMTSDDVSAASLINRRF